MNWSITRQGYSPEQTADDGNRFLVGNGYLGVRGTLEEAGKEQLVAVNLAGIYDQVGEGWREPLNAPNPFLTRFRDEARCYDAQENAPSAHQQTLDFRHGILRRETLWEQGEARVTLTGERFAALHAPHILCMRMCLAASRGGAFTLHAGIDGDVWDMYGPHYGTVVHTYEQNTQLATATVANSGDVVAVARKSFLLQGGRIAQPSARQLAEGYSLSLAQDEPCTLVSLCAVYTGKDVENPAQAAGAALSGLTHTDYENLLAQSRAAWDAVWAGSLATIEGDAQAEQALNYSLYQLNCIAPRQGGVRSIPARGLSGQTYKGAVFWDTEIFILDYFLHTQPEIAKCLVQYRIHTLPGALQKAKQYGYEGAFYAWESHEGGLDACSDYNVTDVFTGRPVRTYFRDKQIHISSAVVYALMRYIAYTGDVSLLEQGGARMVYECARFYLSRMVLPMNTQRLELHDVIGPDEYHERVNNNAYTNRMAHFTLSAALEVQALLMQAEPKSAASLHCEYAGLFSRIAEAKSRLYSPACNEAGIIEQFDGYFALEDAPLSAVKGRLKHPQEYWGGGSGVASDTQIIKQADVLAMMELFHEEYTPAQIEANWSYYEPRTEHGSSLSACMYALTACRFGRADLAYPLFFKSATADLHGGGKQWAGLVYIGGTHPAAAGGAWKVLAQGFLGLHVEGGQPKLAPCLPEHWQRVTLRFVHNGIGYEAVATPQGAHIHACDGAAAIPQGAHIHACDGAAATPQGAHIHTTE